MLQNTSGDFFKRDLFTRQSRRNGFGMGGGKKNFARLRHANFFYITLTYKRDTVFFISISVISKFTELSVYFILIHIYLFISHYFQTLNFFGWQNIGRAIAPPPPLTPLFLRPCSSGRGVWGLQFVNDMLRHRLWYITYVNCWSLSEITNILNKLMQIQYCFEFWYEILYLYLWKQADPQNNT